MSQKSEYLIKKLDNIMNAYGPTILNGSIFDRFKIRRMTREIQKAEIEMLKSVLDDRTLELKEALVENVRLQKSLNDKLQKEKTELRRVLN